MQFDDCLEVGLMVDSASEQVRNSDPIGRYFIWDFASTDFSNQMNHIE